MKKRNVYVREETHKLIAAYMEEEQLSNYAEAVRRIVFEHHDHKVKVEDELRLKLNAIDKELQVMTHLIIFMAESMSATPHGKQLSTLYQSAVDARNEEMKRKMSASRVMFNE